MRSVRLLLVVLTTTALGLAVAPTVANAHTDFDYSLPTDGASVGEPVSEITVAFTSPVTLVGDGFAVLDPQGNELAPFAVTDDDAVFRLQFDPPLAGGTVAVKYEVRADDGHVLSGNFVFDIDAQLPTTTTSTTTSTTTTTVPGTTTPSEASVSPTTGAIATTSPPTASTTTPPDANDALDSESATLDDVAAEVVDDGATGGGGSGAGLAIAIAVVVALAAGGFALVRSRTSA